MNFQKFVKNENFQLGLVVVLAVAGILGFREYRAHIKKQNQNLEFLQKRTDGALKEIAESAKNILYVGFGNSYTLVPKTHILQAPEEDLVYSVEPQKEKNYRNPYRMAFEHSNRFFILRIQREMIKEPKIKLTRQKVDEAKQQNPGKLIFIADQNSTMTFEYEIVEQ